MSLTELQAAIEALPRTDKVRLLQALARDLSGDDADLIQPNASYPVWTPYNEFAAAATLQHSLEAERDQ